MANTPASEQEETEIPGDSERRARLIYWVKEAMHRNGIKSVAALARGMQAPYSSVDRWLREPGTAQMPMVWIGPLCRTLRVDPMLIALLKPIPADPLGQYQLAEDDPFAVALDATRLATLDTVEAVEEPRPAADEPPAQPRRRAASSSR